jgi:hypothetical protein
MVLIVAFATTALAALAQPLTELNQERTKVIA